MRRVAALLVAAVLTAGCMDEARVNDTCRWSDNDARRLDLTRSADREHLRVDARVAEELVVRFGDAHGRNRPDLQRPFREQCLQALTDSIVARHGVTTAHVQAAAHARVWWIDIAVVFLPLAALTFLAMDAITRRVCRAFEPEDRVIATVSVLLLVPAVAAIAVGVAQFWGFQVEGMLLRNSHVSNRAFHVPAVVHGWFTLAAALGVCIVAAALRFARTPFTGGDRHSFAPGTRTRVSRR
jgi:hypothetical protein